MQTDQLVKRGIVMSRPEIQTSKKKTFWDIPSAAEAAGFSLRHFRRNIDEENVPIVQIGRKFFLLGRDFETWRASQEEKRKP